MNRPILMSAGTSRRRFLKVAAATSAAFFAGAARRGYGRIAGNGRGGPSGRALRNQEAVVHWRGIALGTDVSIELFSSDEAAAHDALGACRREIARLEGIFSLYDERSAAGRLNRDGVLLQAPAELRELVRFCGDFSELSGGAFDIAIQPLIELLRDSGGKASVREIEEVLPRCDHRGIACKGDSIRFNRPGMRVTFNGVAQGYITDCVADLLRERGFGHTLIDLGEKRALGPHPEGRPWGIGIESPDARGSLAGVVDLADRALATSGSYGEVFGTGGCHHLVDARSGSCPRTFESVSVVAERAVVADALSTCLCVCAPSRIQPILAGFPGVEVWVVGAGETKLRQLG